MKKTAVRLPRWSPKKGWIGGSKHTLFVFTDDLISFSRVAPPYGAKMGEGASVRVATREEAEGNVPGIEGWQNPLHAGWSVL